MKNRYASVREVDEMTVALHSVVAVPRPVTPATDFWEVLHSFSNQSLWRYFHCDGDGRWIHQGLLCGSLVIVHDGSYMVEVDKSVCSAGFMIYCKNTQHKAKGTVVEKSDQADNYRGEILGGLMIQLVLKAAAQTSHSCYEPVQVDCDNIGVVRHGNSASKKLKAKQSQADVLRSLKQLITSQVFDTIYEWVASHQDDKKKWKDLTLRERMNVIVDKLAKLALITGIVDQEFINSDFPFEQLRLRVGGKKITGSIKTAVSNH